MCGGGERLWMGVLDCNGKGYLYPSSSMAKSHLYIMDMINQYLPLYDR